MAAMAVLFSAFGKASIAVVASKLMTADVVVFFWAETCPSEMANTARSIVFFMFVILIYQ
jgi:hypothetical protein